VSADRAKVRADSPKETNPPPAQGVISTREEEKRVEDRVAINAHVVYETIRREGEEELARSDAALAWSALAAGLSMGISFVAEALLKAHLPNQPWTPLVSRFGYSVGFLVVILGRQQLFTENTLRAILPLMHRKNLSTLLRVLRLWAVVLSANLFGTYRFAACIGKIALFDPGVVRTLTEIGNAHIGPAFGIVFGRAIFAGWLIALMVWLLPGAESARVSIIIILAYLVGLAHSITSLRGHPGRGARTCPSGRWPGNARRRPAGPGRCRATTPRESASLRFAEVGKVEAARSKRPKSSAQAKIQILRQ
jgi:formate-nitrite transporter family protein